MKSINWGIILFAAILFISIGDKILPGALGEASANTRNSINNFLIGLVPHWKPSVDPNKRTEDAIKKEE
ncbi:MAG: hypothetical protein ACOYME_06720 [Prochlorotrichaceae cyanobacterium]|jgi:predicted membrane protein